MNLYMLKDPNDNTTRYVGITRQTLKERLRQRIKGTRKRERDGTYLSAKDKWVLQKQQ